MHRSRILVMITAMLVAGAAHAATEDSIHKTFNVAPGGTLTLDTDVGDVRVDPGASGVTIDVRRHARTADIMRDFQITFDQAGNNVNVRGTYTHSSHWFDWGNDLSAQFVVTVPSNYNIHVSTSGGDIRLADFTGEIRVKTSGGNLEVGRINGPVDARTSGGDVKLESATAAIDLRTSGGSITLGQAGSSVQARTSGGSIDIRRVAGDLYAHTSGGSIVVQDALGAIDGETSGGSIRARFSQQPHADSRLSTSGGGITVSVAGNVAVDLDAHTSGGDVDSDVPITVLGKQSDSTLQGKINGGGPRLVLRSSGGGIHVKRM